MPHLRARQTGLRGQLGALDAQAADRDAYLKLADDLEGFLAQLRGNAATATVEERQRVLRLLVKDILIGAREDHIRHRIPARPGTSGARQRDPQPDTEVTIARVIHCVGGVKMPPCGVPVSVSRCSPSSVSTPALRNAFTSASTRLSLTRARTRSITAGVRDVVEAASMSASSTSG